jgi:N-acetylglucosamine-6-phosphate deacetylase
MVAYTEGTTNQIYEAADNGATLLDHFFNGFPLMDHHFEGSTIGCLLEDRLYCQMQMDHVHVAEPFIRLTMRVKGADRIIATHDGSEFIGAPDGEYTRGTDPDSPTYKLYKKDGKVTNKDGKLVTGCNSYDENMRVSYSKGYSLEDLGKIFSENAPKMLRLTDRGKIEAGRRADIVIMDKKLHVKKTLILGEVVFGN